MNAHVPAARRGWPARLVNLAVVIVLLALAAATFVLSYTGVHVIALQAGTSARLARIYPGVFDAVLVIACLAAVMLRGARWWARGYAWLAIIVVVGVAGAADAVHAMSVALPRRQTEAVVAAAPWVLALLGFTLMLTMLRQSRAPRPTAIPTATPGTPPAGPPAELAVRLVAPALPAAVADRPAQWPTSELPAQTPPAEPAAADTQAPALVVPLCTEPDDPPAEASGSEGTANHDDAMTEEASLEEETAAFSGTSTPEQTATATEPSTDASASAGTGSHTRPLSGWIERVADSGQSADAGALPHLMTVPHLNRVRATPMPPEEEQELPRA